MDAFRRGNIPKGDSMFVAVIVYRSLNGFQKVESPVNMETLRRSAFDTQEQAVTAATEMFTYEGKTYRDGRVFVIDTETASVVHNTEFKAAVPYPATDDVEVLPESTSAAN